MSSFLIRRHTRAASLAEQKPEIEQLTATERRILRLVADGLTSREIAGQLAIGVRTVEHHRNNVAVKLELRGSHALTKFALRHKSDL